MFINREEWVSGVIIFGVIVVQLDAIYVIICMQIEAHFYEYFRNKNIFLTIGKPFINVSSNVCYFYQVFKYFCFSYSDFFLPLSKFISLNSRKPNFIYIFTYLVTVNCTLQYSLKHSIIILRMLSVLQSDISHLGMVIFTSRSFYPTSFGNIT